MELGKLLKALLSATKRNKPIPGENIDIEYTPDGAVIHGTSEGKEGIGGGFSYNGFFKISVTSDEEENSIEIAEGFVVGGKDTFLVESDTLTAAIDQDGYIFLKISCDGSDPDNPIYSGVFEFANKTENLETDLDVQTDTEYYKLLGRIVNNSAEQFHIGIIYMEGRVF